MAFWNKKIIDFKNRYLGLDISDSSIKVFQLEESGSTDKIRSFGVKEIPAGWIENGKIINQENVIATIKDLLNTNSPKKINTRKVICSLPESKVFLHVVTVPEMSKEEAGEAIKWEIEASIPLSIDQVYYDWQFLDKKDGKQDVLTASVAKDFSDELCLVLEKCGLEVYCFEMESIAMVRSLISKNVKTEEVFLIVDIGSNKTSFIIVEGNIPYFTSSIPFSSSAITDEISSQLNLNQEEADQIKISKGIENADCSNPISSSINHLLESLSTEIEKTIDFYQSMPNKSLKPLRIILAGGGANFKGLLAYLKSKLPWEVVMGDPWINLNLGKKLPAISQADSLRYAVSAGLTMGEETKKINLNLIPLERKRNIAKKNQLLTIIRAESFFALILAVFLAMLLIFNYILNLNLDSTVKNEEKKENSEKYSKLKEYDTSFSQINRKLADVVSIKNNQLYWSRLFLKLNDYIFPGIEIKSINTSDYFISLQGVSDTRDNLILFKEKLSSEKCFSNINLPLDDLVNKNNISFKIDFFIDESCLKNK